MSFLFALLSGLGVGSGGLYILFLVLVKNMPQTEAQGLNLLFFSLCVFAATLVNVHCQRIVKGALLPIILFGILTSIPASFLASKVDSELLSRLFGAFLVFAGASGLVPRKK